MNGSSAVKDDKQSATTDASDKGSSDKGHAGISTGNSGTGLGSLGSSGGSRSKQRYRSVPIVTTPTRGNGGASSSDEEDEDKNMDRGEKIPSFHNSRGVPPSVGSNNNSSSNEASTSSQSAANGTSATVSAENERQVLILMLLAQVCALHDPTPRTFTVHVLELFERGILGHRSIHFLFELGLVPATTPKLLTQHANNGPPSDNDSKEEVLDLATIPTPLSPQTIRTHEASVIRSHLEQHDLAQQQQQQQQQPRATNTSILGSSSTSGSWAVEHHPLSLSRYQREFHQIRLLNSGSFGEVFHATQKVDLKDYAVKRVAFSAYGYSKESVSQVIREVHCLAQCDHPNVVRYFCSWLEPSWMTGSGATIISPTGNPNADVRRQQKLLTDIQHMMISGAESSSADQSTSHPSASISENNHLQDYFQGHAATLRNRKFSIGSSLDSVDSASVGSSYDETSSEEEEGEDYSAWTIEEESHSRVTFENDNSLFFSAHHEQHTTISSPPRRYKAAQGAAKKQAEARVKYRYQICLFIQMQLCQPATLGDWIRHRNSLCTDPTENRRERVETAVRIFKQISGGLQHIHNKGIVHRDIKPHNMFQSLEEDGVFLIGDFGLSKLIHSATHQPSKKRHKNQHPLSPVDILPAKETSDLVLHFPTELTAGVGTASYAAPEQVTTQSYGKRADVFSLGLILLELVCCFTTEHERMETFNDCRRRRQIPAWISEEYPMLAKTILACTEPNPSNRPTAEDLTTTDLLKPFSFQSDGGANISELHQVSGGDEVRNLKQELEEKREVIVAYEKKLEEKDRIIEALQEQLAKQKLEQDTDEKESCTNVAFPMPIPKNGDLDIAEVESSSSSSDEGGG